MKSKPLTELSMDELLELKSSVEEKIRHCYIYDGYCEKLEISKYGEYKMLFDKVFTGISRFCFIENKSEFWRDFERLIQLAEFKGYELHAKQIYEKFVFLEEITKEIEEKDKYSY